MGECEPNLIMSGLSGVFTQDGINVEVNIVRLEHTDWSLEVVNDVGTSIVWDELFSSDVAAHEEFRRTVADEGMNIFLGDGNVIPFRR